MVVLCPFCSKNIKLELLVKHWRLRHLGEFRSIKCNFKGCSRKMSSIHSYVKHFSTDHKNHFEISINYSIDIQNSPNNESSLLNNIGNEKTIGVTVSSSKNVLKLEQ